MEKFIDYCKKNALEYHVMNNGTLIAILSDNELIYAFLKDDSLLMGYDAKVYKNILKGRKIDFDEFLEILYKMPTRAEADKINKEAWEKRKKARESKQKL